MEALMEELLVRCTFYLGNKDLGTFFVCTDIELGQTFRYEFPAIEGEREKMALRVTRLQKIIQGGEMYFHAEVEPVHLPVLPTLTVT
jgi:hypothetical protein